MNSNLIFWNASTLMQVFNFARKRVKVMSGRPAKVNSGTHDENSVSPV